MPPAFEVFEFDDSPAYIRGDAARWLCHWDGLVGQPAEEVILGWRARDTVALVCTSGREYNEIDARQRTAHIALGALSGTALPLPARRDADPAATFREIERLSSQDTLWHSATDLHEFTVVREPGFAAGYRLLEAGALFVASTGLAREQLQARPVLDWTVYDLT
jgi:hypothetical protein